jgi:hypothetical protein
MTSCSLRRLQELSVTHGNGGTATAATASDEGVGTRKQLLGTFRRLCCETYPAGASRSPGTSPHGGSHFTLGCHMAENGSRG